MITRIFRVRVFPELREAFEDEFRDVSVRAVENAPGFIAVAIGRPTLWAPDEYVMISHWQSEEAVKRFAGENWNDAVIPPGMERFIDECWVHHYASFDSRPVD